MSGDTYSQSSSNFSDSMQGGVDQRTGVYTASLMIAHLKANGGAGPSLPLTLNYDPSNRLNSGFGYGWGMAWPRYQQSDGSVVFAMGDKYQSRTLSGEISLIDQKVVNAKASNASSDFSSQGYVFQHRKGEIYVVDKLTQHEHWVPSRIIGAHGLGVTLSWDDTGRLLSITDEAPNKSGVCAVLVSFDYNGVAGATITLWPGTNVERKITLTCQDEYLNTVKIANQQWKMSYDTQNTSFGPHPLTGLEYPSGSIETVTYTSDGGGHQYPDCANQGQYTVPYVTRYTKKVNGNKIDRSISYRFSDKNYLGFNSQLSVWKSDEDNLYNVESDYTYSSTVTRTDDDGTKVVTTNVYNKFHLMVTQTTEKNNNVSTTSHSYDITDGGFANQVAYFQSPIKTETTFNDGITTKTYSSTNKYDDHGNKIQTIHPDGTVEDWEYYPADGGNSDCPAAHLGVDTYLKSHTVTRPNRPGMPDAPILKTVSKYVKFYWDENETYYGIVSSRGETYSDDVLISSSDVGYFSKPRSYFHGMVTSHVTTLYDGEEKFPTSVSMDYADKDGTIVVNTTTKSHDGLSKNTEATSCAYTGSALRRKNTQGNVEEYTYDSIGRITSHTICADDDNYKHSKQFAYGEERLEDNTSYRTVTIKNPQNVVSKHIMNGEGQLLRETTQVGHGVEQTLLERSFDNRGRLTTVTMMDYLSSDGISLENGGITPIEQTDVVSSNVRSLSYDDWEQQDQYSLQSGAKVVQKYDPVKLNALEQVGQDGVNGSRVTAFDEAYLPYQIQMKDEKGKPVATELVAYDGASRLLSHTNALGQTTQFAYDRFDRLIETTYPDGMVVYRTYFPHRTDKQIASIKVNDTVIASQTVDGFGRVLTRIIGGRRYTFTYDSDAASKPSKVDLPDGTSLTYERISQLGEVPSKVTTSDGTYRTFEYDVITGQPTKITQSKPGGDQDALVITLTYTPRGKVHTRNVQDLNDKTNRLCTYEYSIGGALLSYTDDTGATQITYDQYGRKQTVTKNGVTTTFNYGANNLLTGWETTDDKENNNTLTITYDAFNRVVSRTITDTASSLILTIYLEYDEINRIVQKTISNEFDATKFSEYYSYDAGGRLIKVEYYGDGGPQNSSGEKIESIEYSYDNFGNVITKNESARNSANNYEYNYRNDEDPYQLTSIGNDEELVYDKAGRLTKTKSGTYTYDSFGQIASFETPDGLVAYYQYDGNGKLRSQTDQEKKREFFYLNGKVVAEIVTSKDGEVRIARAYHQQYPIAQYSDSDTPAFFACDQGGTVLAVSKDGQCTSVLYLPFGEAESPGEFYPGYDGEIADSVSGHYHLGQGYRTYIPSLMHFNKPDSASPFGAGGLSWYGYVNNDPINNADPTGHYSTGKATSSTGSIKAIVLGVIGIGISIYFGGPLIETMFEGGLAAGAMGGLSLLSIAGAVASVGLQIAAAVEAPKNPKKSAKLSDWSQGLGILSAASSFGLSKLAPTAVTEAAEVALEERVVSPSDELEKEASKLLSPADSAQTQAVNNVTENIYENITSGRLSESTELTESTLQRSDSIRSGFTSLRNRFGDYDFEEVSSVGEGSHGLPALPPAPTPPPTSPAHAADLFSEGSESALSSKKKLIDKRGV